jgi:hypothetical protein
MSEEPLPPSGLEQLLAPQRLLRSRFDDFLRALGRRDRAAYELALRDFEASQRNWTQAEERLLLPVLSRVGVPGRDPQRELKLEYVQIRELTRYIVDQVSRNSPIGDVLGLVENLDRRIAAHEAEMEQVYYPAAAPALSEAERLAFSRAAPAP